MKKQIKLLIGMHLFLSACSSTEETETDGLTTYSYKYDVFGGNTDINATEEMIEYIIPSPYEITIDDSFERVSRYTSNMPPEQMLFWHTESFENMTHEIDSETSREDLKTHVPTLELILYNKYQHFMVSNPDLFSANPTEEEIEEVLAKFKNFVDNPPEGHMDEFIEELLLLTETEPIIADISEDNHLFTHQIEHKEDSFEHYQYVGETDTAYLTATVTVPNDQSEEYLPTIQDALSRLTFTLEEFSDEPNYDLAETLSYEPSDYGDGYPKIGYSFQVPEEVEFYLSFPSLNPYRYHFVHQYSNYEEWEYVEQSVSRFDIFAAPRGSARNRESDILSKQPQEFTAYLGDKVTEVDYLHEDPDADIGIFTTAVRVEFESGYEIYIFLYETEGHVFEIEFDFSHEAPESAELLEEYFKVVRSFELINPDS